MKVLMIDNYDSFTYNLVQYLGELGAAVEVVRNDEIDVDAVRASDASHVMISPGPCTPNEAGISMAAIEALAGERPVLGVCLGHQSIGAALGGRIVRAQQQMHGKASTLTTDEQGVYLGLPRQFSVIRYHSLVIEKASLPEQLEITSSTPDGEIMGVRHSALAGSRTPLEGVQFHPESILTEHGHAMLKNFLDLSRRAA